MPSFGPASLMKLATCDPELKLLFMEVIKHFDCTVTEGYRDKTAQDLDFQNGRTKLQWPNGKHNHNPSYAVDVVPYPVDYSDLHKIYYFAGFVMGLATQLREEGKMTKSIRWGGNWNMDDNLSSNKFNDLVHFELHDG